MAMTSGIMWMGKLWPGVWHDRQLEPAELFNMLKEMGIETIDIFARAADEYGADTLEAALKDSGLKCACYYISADLITEDPEKKRAADEAFPKGIEVARQLGAPLCFTHGSQHAHAGEENLQKYIDRLGEKLQLFKDTDITLVIENAGTLMHSADQMIRVCEALADEGLRLCPDTGNFTLWGQDEIDAVTRCLPWAAHFHIKDYAERWEKDGSVGGTEAVLGQGITPVAEIIDILKREQWSGVLAWEPGPQDEQGVQDSIAELLRLIG